MKSYSILIKQIIVGTILMGLTTVNATAAAAAAAAATTTTTTTTTPAAAATTAPAAAKPTTPPPINPANVDNNVELQKCIEGVVKDANGAPNGNEMVACTQKYGHPTNIPSAHSSPNTPPAMGH
jgi:hypothetical protein